MPGSLKEVLEWYRLTVLKLKETRSVNKTLHKQVLSELISDGGERAEEALCALQYCRYELDDFDLAIGTINNSIVRNNNNQEFKNSAGEIIILINRLKELYNALLIDDILETKSNVNKVISVVTNELLSMHGEKINR